MYNYKYSNVLQDVLTPDICVHFSPITVAHSMNGGFEEGFIMHKVSVYTTTTHNHVNEVFL